MRTRVCALMGAALVVGLGLAPGKTDAQSLTGLRGLGYPMMATDARTEALGGLGVGLMGLSVPFTNPAAAASVTQRGVVVSAAVTERTSTLGDASSRSGATRFPILRILFPVRGVVVTGGYGTFLDQSWAVVREGSQQLGAADSVGYEDVLQSVGGVGQAHLGAAVPLGERLAVGVTVGSYTGSQRLTLRRRYDTTAIGNLQSYSETREVQYTGPLARIGFRWDPVEVLRLGGSVTWSGTLRADSIRGAATGRSHSLPLQVAGGASAYLSRSLLVGLSGRWSGWSVTSPGEGAVSEEAAGPSRDTWEVGGGIEWDDPARRQTRSFPLRLGFQYRQLPFTFVSDQPTEWLVTGGVGMRIGSDFETPVARIDLTVQRGARSAAGSDDIPALDETLWRVVLGIAIFGT